MKRPFETMKEILLENQVRSKENSRFIFDHSDKLMTWIIGFATTGLTLIVSKISDFNSLFSLHVVKLTLYLLITSITAGILYRVFFYLAHVQLRGIEMYLENALANRQYMRIIPTDVSDINDFRELIRRIQVDFGEDLSELIKMYDDGSSEVKNELINSMKLHYKNTNEWAKADHEYAINYIKDTYKKAFGLSDKKVSKMFVETTLNSSKFKFFGYTSTACFVISILSFTITIFLLAIKY